MPTKQRSFAVREGDSVGRGGIVTRVFQPDKYGHRYVLVFWDHHSACPHCHGKPKKHRADKLRSERIVSCGKVKAALYRKHIQRQAGIDAATGEPITPIMPKRKPKKPL